MSEKKSFWTTLPGILTGIAGIITALGGLLVILFQIGVIGQKVNSTKSESKERVTQTPAGQAKAPKVSEQPAAVPSAPMKNKLHLSAGSMTVIPELNIGVKLSADHNFERKAGGVRLSFSFPKNPLGKITERNKVDESVVSIVPHWIRRDIAQVISLGELGRFEVSVSDHAFNEAHDFVISLELSIRQVGK